MAYDLVVGKSNKIKDNPSIIGSIEFEQYPALTSLYKHAEHPFLAKLCNQFSDATFSLRELETAKLHLYQLMVSGKLNDVEQAIIYKLISAVCFAIDTQQYLFGVAD